jgi:hypothetical protein
MKKIALDEEFSAVGGIYVFTNKEGKIVLQRVRNAGKTKEFIPPTIEEVKEFFKSRGYSAEAAAKFHDYYSLGNWKDGKGNPVKVWKQKASSVWFRPEHLIKEEPAKDNKKEGKFMF